MTEGLSLCVFLKKKKKRKKKTLPRRRGRREGHTYGSSELGRKHLPHSPHAESGQSPAEQEKEREKDVDVLGHIELEVPKGLWLRDVPAVQALAGLSCGPCLLDNMKSQGQNTRDRHKKPSQGCIE